MDDRRGRLAGPVAGELALGRERDAGDARAAVAGGLADEQDRRVGARVEVAREPLGEALVAVLVERRADPRGGEPLHERFALTGPSVTRD